MCGDKNVTEVVQALHSREELVQKLQKKINDLKEENDDLEEENAELTERSQYLQVRK